MKIESLHFNPYAQDVPPVQPVANVGDPASRHENFRKAVGNVAGVELARPPADAFVYDARATLLRATDHGFVKITTPDGLLMLGPGAAFVVER